jgi:hypothetical protein
LQSGVGFAGIGGRGSEVCRIDGLDDREAKHDVGESDEGDSDFEDGLYYDSRLGLIDG